MKKTKLQELRESLNMSLRDIRKNIGIHQSAWCRWENGKYKPSPKNCYIIINFAKKHGINIEMEELIPNS